MPSSASELFAAAGLVQSGSVAWGERIGSQSAGTYVVELPAPIADPPIDRTAIAQWLVDVPRISMRNSTPSVADLVSELDRWWISDETVLYVGKATTLSSRLSAYYRTPLGRRSPHRGGQWLKTLTVLAGLRIHYAETPNVSAAEDAEDAMILAFAAGVSVDTRKSHPEPELAIPFANLQVRRSGRTQRRRHAIARSTI